jgi:hypothetical protein
LPYHYGFAERSAPLAATPRHTGNIFNHGYLGSCSNALVKYDILPRMKKRIISDDVPDKEGLAANWLDLEKICVIEITSEDGSYPIEGALLPDRNQGWKAGTPGTQTIRLLFNQPQDIRRIQLGFVETEVERSQEYVLRWSQDNGQTYAEIVRQQWNFSPDGSKAELADYTMALMGITALELIITPDISSQEAIATLEKLRIA